MRCCQIDMRVMQAETDEEGEYLLFVCPVCGRQEKLYPVPKEQEDPAL